MCFRHMDSIALKLSTISRTSRHSRTSIAILLIVIIAISLIVIIAILLIVIIAISLIVIIAIILIRVGLRG